MSLYIRNRVHLYWLTCVTDVVQEYSLTWNFELENVDEPRHITADSLEVPKYARNLAQSSLRHR